MTIHASKGLEYHICYFSGLYKKFNILDLKELLSYSPDYGLILPYYDKGPKSTILKTLTKQKYMLDEISEKLRLFYVALTRAREKIILVLELEENILAYKNGSIIDDEARLKFMSFKDMLDSIYPSIKNYIKNVDLENIGLTKDYNFSRFVSYKDTLKEGEKILVKEYVDNSKVTENKHFSKEVHNLHTKEEFNNILMGKKLHQELEELDFNNSTDSRFKKLLERDIFKNAKNIYKEYEFMYEEDNKKMHGFIDCLIEYDDKYIIIDYKLKNVIDDAYKKQLHGYKKYIEDITGKLVYTYLYSLVDDELIAIVK
jgi:ATP-dependent helicase/nuclease subunit A